MLLFRHKNPSFSELNILHEQTVMYPFYCRWEFSDPLDFTIMGSAAVNTLTYVFGWTFISISAGGELGGLKMSSLRRSYQFNVQGRVVPLYIFTFNI